ncbi:MAG: LD-carboxypeptidase [Bacillota bacterium]|nr:MAG: LD-carboxypeptidase [Bacillota bacterium]
MRPGPIRPVRLAPGDVVGVVSPSAPAAAECPRRLRRGIAELGRRGFRVRLGRYATASTGHTAGTIAQRLDDLHAMFRDPEVRAIITTVGGYSSHQLLEDLDYDLIRRHPKLLIGHSDITALHAAIHARTGLVTVLGPAVMPQFGEYGGVHPYTWDMFVRVVMRLQPAGELEPAREWTPEKLRWDVADDRPRRYIPNPGPRTLSPGVAEGPILAGNAGTLLLLAGTPYWPDVDGVILCLEEDELESPATVDRMLTQLRHMGVFGRIAGLILGRFHPQVGFSPKDPLEEIVLRATRGYDIPIAIDFDFGHTDPMFPLPLGVRARLEAAPDRPRLVLLEPAVR